MSATARQAQDQPGLAERLGIKPGQVVQELGYDDDCDEQLREAIASLQDVELVDEDYDDVVDVVLLWWRDGDGDLVDALVDALTPLADGGYIWLLTPKAGRPGHVELFVSIVRLRLAGERVDPEAAAEEADRLLGITRTAPAELTGASRSPSETGPGLPGPEL